MIGARGWRLALAAMATTLVLVGCSDSPPPRFFTLAAQPGTQYGAAPGVVAVSPVDFPKYLDRPQLVRYSDPYELHLSEFEHWGEGMRDMVTRVLVADLAMRLPRAKLVAAGSLSATSDATVEVNLSRFDAEPGGAVVLNALWSVQPSRGRGGVQAAEIRVDGRGTGPTELAAAMSEALSQLSDRIAKSIAG